MPHAPPSTRASTADDALATLERASPPKRRLRHRFVPPVVLQSDENDCGAACLAMLAQVHGQPLSLQFWRRRMQIGRSGTSIGALIECAEASGFESTAIATARLRDLPDAAYPFLLVRNQHYVVAFRRTRRHLLVGDPALGRARLPIDALEAEGELVCVLLQPTPALQSLHEDRAGRYRFAWQVWRPLRLRFAVAFLIALAGVAVSLLPPYATKLYYDRAIPLRDRDEWLLATAVSLAAVIAVRLQQWLDEYLLIRMRRLFDQDAQRRFIDALMRVAFLAYHSRSAGDYLRRFNELRQVLELVTRGLIPIAVNALRLIAYTAAFFWVDGHLGLFAVVAIPVLVALPLLFQDRLNGLYNRSFQTQAELIGFVGELTANMRSVRLLDAGDYVRRRFALLSSATVDANASRERFDTNTRHLAVLLTEIVSVLFVAAVVLLALQGRLSIGDVSFLMLLALMVFQLSPAVARYWDSLATLRLALGRINDISLADTEPASGLDRLPASPAIELRDVCFRYGDSQSPWVLQGLSFTLAPGERVALMGENGSGKSTVVALLCRLFEPVRGAILIDGRDHREHTTRALRSVIGSLTQEPELFSGTIIENITMGRTDLDPEVLARALRVSRADELLRDPGLARLRLSAGGSNLSGGQRQRVALARLLARAPRVLCLDEFSSNMDAATEAAILDAIQREYRDCTILHISHRKEAILSCDRAIWLHQGRAIMTGPAATVLDRYLAGDAPTEPISS